MPSAINLHWQAERIAFTLQATMAVICLISRIAGIAIAVLALTRPTGAAENVWLEDMPDYTWHAGCFGTASGNLIGYWDRHGLPNMYIGPTGGGLAPLNSSTFQQNGGIISLWASQQGVDGRPMNKPGHIEDYWHSQNGTGSFEGTQEDPYEVLGRAEHAPDCLGDFIGQSQRKYDDLNGECSGNIDGYAFNFWDKSGARSTNFVPPRVNGPVRDIQSGLAAWSRYRGYGAETTSQLANVNPEAPVGTGFTFDDITAEIRAGYPVMLILQNHNNFSRPLPGNPRANPSCHAIIVFGYVVTDGGESRYIRFRSSWGDGMEWIAEWNSEIIVANLPLRGAITYHPEPKITAVGRSGGQVRVTWEGPNSSLYDFTTETSTPVHRYVVERANDLQPGAFTPVTDPTTEREASLADTNAKEAYFRVRLVSN